MKKPSKEAMLRYRLSYSARKKGFKVNGYKRRIYIHFNRVNNLIHTHETISLVRNHNFQVVQDRQLKLF